MLLWFRYIYHFLLHLAAMRTDNENYLEPSIAVIRRNNCEVETNRENCQKIVEDCSISYMQ